MESQFDQARQRFEQEFPEGEPILTIPRLGVVLYTPQFKFIGYVAMACCALGIGIGLMLGDGLKRREAQFRESDRQQQVEAIPPATVAPQTD